MKKLYAFLFLILFSLSGLCAKNWTNNIGFGPLFAYSLLGLEDSDDISQLSYGINGTYLGIHENGFTFKADVAVGATTSKDIKIQDRNVNVGIFENLIFGLGYSFFNTKKVVFGLAGIVGVELAQYGEEEQNVNYDSHTADFKKSNSIVAVSVGADLFGIYRFTDTFGIFLNLGTSYILSGKNTQEEKYEWKSSGLKKVHSVSAENKLRGKILVQPTIGVIWTF